MVPSIRRSRSILDWRGSLLIKDCRRCIWPTMLPNSGRQGTGTGTLNMSSNATGGSISLNQGVEEIFREIEPPVAFDDIFKVPVPVPCLPEFGSIVGQIQRRQSLIRSDPRQSRMLLDRRIDGTILVGGAVIVTERDQRPEFKPQLLWPFWVIVLLQFILHDRAVFTMDHEN